MKWEKWWNINCSLWTNIKPNKFYFKVWINKVTNSGTINAGTITLNGGDIDNRNGTITSSGDIDVTGNTNIEGTLNADLDINVDATLGTVSGITGVELVLDARNIYVNSGGSVIIQISMEVLVEQLGLNASNTTLVDGSVVSIGASRSGAVGGKIYVTASDLTGSGSINATGGTGGHIQTVLIVELVAEMVEKFQFTLLMKIMKVHMLSLRMLGYILSGRKRICFLV